MAAGDTMHGRRCDAELHEMEPGDYGRMPGRKMWLCRTPTGNGGSLGGHEVTEHEDGAITVSPSILVNRDPAGPAWHGYLEHGVWREV